MSAVEGSLFESVQNDFLIFWMPSFSSGMFVTFKLSLIPEFIGDLKELLMLPLVYGIAFSLKKFSQQDKVLYRYVTWLEIAVGFVVLFFIFEVLFSLHLPKIQPLPVKIDEKFCSFHTCLRFNPICRDGWEVLLSQHLSNIQPPAVKIVEMFC